VDIDLLNRWYDPIKVHLGQTAPKVDAALANVTLVGEYFVREHLNLSWIVNGYERREREDC
jgi:hypothetical protein